MSMARFSAPLIICSVAFPLVIVLTIVYQNQMFYLFGGFSKVTILKGQDKNSADSYSFEATYIPEDMLLGEFSTSGEDAGSCLSRYQSVLYRKSSSHKPSPYLRSKLRDYEKLHKQCGPYTEMYNRTVKGLESGNVSEPTGCKYVVWLGLEGLGNRILSMASAFLYALLTNRVLLVEFETDMADLFCDPFPNTTWLLPADFPLKNQFKLFDHRFPHSYGNMLRFNNINAIMNLSPLSMYIYLPHNSDDRDKLFYCEENQAVLGKIPWLIIKSDQYFIPSLFLIPSLEQEQNKMFPDKEMVFHNLAQYLFLPSNKAWGLITRFYQSYLAKANKRIGLQIRVFNPKNSPFQRVMDQLLACVLKEKLLPQVDTQNLTIPASKNLTRKAILVVSLYSEYYEYIKNMYWTAPSTTGEVIGVYQPSHEGYQHFGDDMHNMKAWVEMNLLSLCDDLVTSTWSTFGYVAQGLGGLRPWILYMPEKRMTPNPACRRPNSIEPCYHIPPSYECRSGTKVKADLGTLVPHIKHCEDATCGIKLVNKVV